MKNVIEALLIVWPRSIPANEYERALSLASKFGALAPSLRVEQNATEKPSAVPKKPVALIGSPGLQKIRDALSTGEASAEEIREATGLSQSSCWQGLKQIAKISAYRVHPNGYTRIPLYALKPEAK